MLINETSPQQSAQLQWLNAVVFYESYFKIIKDRMDALDMLEYSPQLELKNGFSKKLDFLIMRLNELSTDVSEHIKEIEFERVFDNRLDRVIQSDYHNGHHEIFKDFEVDVNDFRTEFNEFFVRCI
jgi:hypothetical protein